VSVDGAPLTATRFTAMAASSVAHIGLGFAPFHFAGRDPDRFHFALTDASAGRLAAALPALRLGRGQRLARLQHFAARGVELRFEDPQPWSLDADIFEPTREIALLATAPLRFLVP
jgi:diacylglycerol kinase family enzyme